MNLLGFIALNGAWVALVCLLALCVDPRTWFWKGREKTAARKERERIALCLMGPIPVAGFDWKERERFSKMFRNALDLADLFMETRK